MAEPMSMSAAILADPQKFADTAKAAVEATGGIINNKGKAIDAIVKARNAIATQNTDKALIVNLTDISCTWYTYNETAPIKAITSMQSHMSPYSTVEVHSVGWGAMSTFKDNRNPPYCVQRNKAYLFDGEHLSLFFSRD